MKKITFIAVAFCALVSCSKETPEITFEEQELVPMTFTASIEDTKAFIDGVKTSWNAGDKISVAKLLLNTKVTDAPVLTAQSSGSSTTFSGDAPADLETYYAFYPADEVTSWNNSANTSVAAAFSKLQNVQDVKCVGQNSEGKDVYIDPRVMFLGGTAGTDLNFTFKHVVAYIKFEVPVSTVLKIQTVTFTDAATDGGTGQTSIAGTCNFNGKSNWAFGLTGTSKSIALKYTNGTSSNKVLPAGVYYMAVRPSKELKCSRFNFLNSAGTKHAYRSKDGAITFQPGKVYSIGEIPETLFD